LNLDNQKKNPEAVFILKGFGIFTLKQKGTHSFWELF